MQKCHNWAIIVSPGFYVLVAVYMLLVPFPWIAAWFVASAVHELCHCVVLKACKVNIISLHIDIGGAKIQTEPMKPACEAISVIAGPVGGGLLMLLSGFFPRLAICACIQTLFNLLPIYPWDGGRVFRIVMGLFFSDASTEKICNWFAWSLLLFLFLCACKLSFRIHLGITPFAVWVIILLKCGKIKIPCKERKQIVQ